jgi:uncharacterized protein (DUF1330 family)
MRSDGVRHGGVPVYVVAQITITDRERSQAYQAGFPEVFSKYRGELLAVDENARVVEGEWPYTRTVLIRFPDEDEATRWYSSAEYQAIAQHRFAASRTNAVLVTGLA